MPLNDGKPVLASHLGTTGVRDPHIIRNPDTGTWYIIATDLRVFGGDDGGWYEWSIAPARISSSGNPTICCIGASRACLTCPASRTAPIWSSAWPGPANAFGCRTTIRKVIMAVAAHSSCIGPAPCSTTRIGRTTTRTSYCTVAVGRHHRFHAGHIRIWRRIHRQPRRRHRHHDDPTSAA